MMKTNLRKHENEQITDDRNEDKNISITIKGIKVLRKPYWKEKNSKEAQRKEDNAAGGQITSRVGRTTVYQSAQKV